MSISDSVTLTPVEPFDIGMNLKLVGEDQLGGGVGRWTVINRPRRRDALEWSGTSGLTYVLPLLLDGVEVSVGRDRPVESECARLVSWAADPTKATHQPTILTAVGPLKTPPSVRWVVTDLAWGAQIRGTDGRRVQQYVTVTLTEYAAATVRKSPAKRVRDQQGQD